jgi:predicted NAD-dependent protein-ADP-ribosyltransferase YbiA (DUF1768 family)
MESMQADALSYRHAAQSLLASYRYTAKLLLCLYQISAFTTILSSRASLVLIVAFPISIHQWSTTRGSASHIEGAYQAAKLENPEDRKAFQGLTGREAKIKGRKITMRDDWEEIKYTVMFSLLLQKFTGDPVLRRILLDTGDRHLEETNNWEDTIWGVDPRFGGHNALGLLIMRVRDFLQAEDAQKALPRISTTKIEDPRQGSLLDCD